MSSKAVVKLVVNLVVKRVVMQAYICRNYARALYSQFASAGHTSIYVHMPLLWPDDLGDTALIQPQ
jgi:hypothetical protein